MWMKPIEIPIEIQIEPHVAHVHLASTTHAPHVTWTHQPDGGREVGRVVSGKSEE